VCRERLRQMRALWELWYAFLLFDCNVFSHISLLVPGAHCTGSLETTSPCLSFASPCLNIILLISLFNPTFILLFKIIFFHHLLWNYSYILSSLVVCLLQYIILFAFHPFQFVFVSVCMMSLSVWDVSSFLFPKIPVIFRKELTLYKREHMRCVVYSVCMWEYGSDKGIVAYVMLGFTESTMLINPPAR